MGSKLSWNPNRAAWNRRKHRVFHSRSKRNRVDSLEIRNQVQYSARWNFIQQGQFYANKSLMIFFKVTLYLLAPPISSKSSKIAIRTFRISKRSPHLDLIREIKKIGIPISQKWLPKMNELEHIDSEMANNYYTKKLIQNYFITSWLFLKNKFKKTGWESENQTR